MAADSTIDDVLSGAARWCIHHGDMLDALPSIPENTVDAVVCDAPYGLSQIDHASVLTMLQCWLNGWSYRHGGFRKGPKNCAGNICGDPIISNPDNGDPGAGDGSVSLSVEALLSRYAMVRSVNFNNELLGWEVEVADNETTGGGENLLVDELDVALLKSLAGRQLCLRKVQGGAACIGLCSAFAQPFSATRSILVLIRNDSFREPGSTSGIVAGAGAELRAVLTFDVGGVSGKLRPAKGADEIHACIELVPAEFVGASPGAGCLSAELEPGCVGHIGSTTARTISFNLLTHERLLDRCLNPIAAAGGMMGRGWDSFVPGPEYWRECFRVLKPGGYMLTFAGTRTQDLMGMAIRLAGFEIVDEVAWLHAVGFPKSVNLERQIAMHQCTLPGRHFASTLPKGKKRRDGDHICPETEESLRWKGQGSALAPSHEPILVARKPLEGTYAENTLKWGTALNIDSCRVGLGGGTQCSRRDADGKCMVHHDRTGTAFGVTYHGPDTNPDGRWPKNTLVSHIPGPNGCRRIGTTTVGANPTWDTPNRDTEPSAFTGERVSKVRHGREGEPSAERRYTEDGSTSFAPTPGARRDAVEDVDVYECVDGCPAKLLGEQSGEADSGTAVRFFQQLHDDESDEPNFLYHAKPSRREKDAGLQHFRPRSAAEATSSNEDDERLGNARTGAGRTGGARNVHPTSKGIAVARWQVRLAARPGQLVLVPFAGGGTECVAALLEGCRVIGIELNDTDAEPFVSIAKARCEHIDGREFVPRESLRTKEPPKQGSLF